MEEIKIFSLGGLNENGKNMYIVEVNKDIFVFDAGLKYADDNLLGIDYIIPNYNYLIDKQEMIQGIFITHGHDEHMGAVMDILHDLPNINIFATSFTYELIKSELENENLPTNNLNLIAPHKKIIFGENVIYPIKLTHSIPEAVGYALITKQGIIFYTGNFIFDPTMSVPYKTDISKLAYLGKEKVLCLLSESLYADKLGFTSPHHRTASIIRETLSKNEGRILFNVFQNNLYQIQELLQEASKTNRKIVILGKMLEKTIIRAIDMKYLQFNKNKIAPIYQVTNDKIIILVSDEREKPYSNIKRIVRGFDKFVKVNENDTIVFATPIYDGLEKSATKLFDDISKIGAQLILLSDKKHLEHHASSEDLRLMIDLIKPEYYFPVIGEYRHQVANARLAQEAGIHNDKIILKLNGQVVTFKNGKLLDNNEEIQIDGKTVGDIGELVLKDRETLGENGVIIITTVFDKKAKKILKEPEIFTKGFILEKDNTDLMKEALKISINIINDNIKIKYIDYNKIKINIREKLGKFLYQETGSKPMILIVTQEI